MATLLVALTGGGRIGIAGVVIAVRDWRRPALLFALLLLGRLLHLVRDAADAHRARRLTNETAARRMGQ